MKRVISLLLVILLVLGCFALTGCDMLENLFNQGDDTEEFDNELTSITGKWLLMDEDTTYFEFDGTKNVMSFKYVENGAQKYSGKFRVVYRGVGNEVLTPLTLIITRSDKTKEDWVGCYVDDFDTDFTQFTILDEEEDLGFIDGSIYTHIYRISQLPYKMGTYILQGKTFKQEANNFATANKNHIPSGTYVLPTGEKFVFVMTKPRSCELFQYINGDIVVEGTFWIAQDNKTIYLYIEHDPYTKVTKADKDRYDTTFDIYYPPDFYLRGNFSGGDSFVINDLYHHGESPTLITDDVWVFGTYTKLAD